MAPAKRRRRIDDENDDDAASHGKIIDVQSASSQQRQASSKRPRVSYATENGDVTDAGASDAQSEVGVDLQANGTQDAASAVDEDKSDSEDEAQSGEEDAAATQAMITRMNRYTENQAAEYGVIEEVFCQNFMCHTKLRIKLGPLINFIIGHNGSGKSAVMTALTLCLGVKANLTNRGGSLKSFIKEGQESAMLSVKIKNQGEMAYQPELFGESIIVERHFNRAGTSTFKIKSAEGRTISTRKADLEDLLDYLALQLDNPMNVLSQDMARQFLSNSTPSDKYKFFLKGTQLEQLDHDYVIMSELLYSTGTRIETRQDDMSVLKRRVDEISAKKKLMDQSRTIRDRIEQLRWMHAWAQVEEVEKQAEQMRASLDEAEVKVEQRRRDFEEKSLQYDNTHRDLQAATSVKDDLTQAVLPIAERHAAMKEEFDSQKLNLIEIQTSRRNIKQDLDAARKSQQKVQQAIKQEEERIEAANGPAQAQRVTALEEAKQEVQDRKSELESRDRTSLEHQQTVLNDKNTKKFAELQPLRQRVADAETRLRDLRNRKDQQSGAYDRNLPNLQRAITNEKRLREKPVGPMGMHVRLLKPEWSSILERTFGGALNAFVVTNRQDQSLLRELMRKTSYDADIYIGNARPIDVSRNEPDPAQDTILRVLGIDNDLVRNQIILNQMADQTVLIKKRSDAYNFMFAGSKPVNVKVTMCMHDHHRGAGIRMAFSRTGQSTNSPVKAWESQARMKTDVEAQIRMQTEMIEQLKHDNDVAGEGYKRVQAELKRAGAALTEFDKQTRQIKMACQKAEDKVEALEGEIDAGTINAGKLDELNDQLREAHSHIQQHTGSYEDVTVERDKINDEQKSLKTELDKVFLELEEANARIKKAEAAIQKRVDIRQKALRLKNDAEDFIGVAQTERQEAEQALNQKQATAEEFAAEAEKIHRRIEVEPGMNADTIDKRLQKLEKERSAAESRAGGSREEVTRAYVQARKEYDTAAKDVNELAGIANDLRKALFNRKYRWKMFRKYITAKAKFTFAYLLAERSFRGHLFVDHKNKEMDISVEPDMSKDSDRGRQAKTLSGGEKSFSTICLLLSIWEAMGSPIRCLDEFDVFMDNVNRDTSMKLMIGAARRAAGKQFILITPQAMGNVQLGNDVKIHKMSDPERGQTALNFA